MEERIGKYLLRKELGRGAASVVYLAFDEFLNADLALKIYLPVPGSEFETAAAVQFVSEASLAGKLVHPHIVTIVDAVAEPGRRYVAMEYVEGGSLRQFTRPDTLLPVSDVVQIAFKCCSALEFASRLGVVHRDIKPSNILMDSGGDIKVADFGAAFIRGVRTTEEFQLSSPSYCPPEQIQGQPPSAQGDMFSLGVMLYELLTGTKPFRGQNVEETLRQIRTASPVPPSVKRPDLPPLLDAVIGRFLKKWPGDRYANWAEAALDLANVGRMSVYRQSIPDSEKFTALKSASLTAGFDDGELWNTVRHARWQRVPAQHVLVTEGEPGDTLLLIAQGSAKVMSQGRLLNVLHTGDCFGEMAYVQGPGSTRSATIQTTTDTIVAEFSRESLSGLSAETQLKLANTMLRVLAERLAFANARISRQ
ncbi:MAG: protein kinase [Betaproteobacteria bacterium]|nr:protein kinase [Betaproteobacteria bacterium]MBL8532475.1 protein kinase [Betaproteobacteria bacterium]